jgi:VCBS repeat-containing protein
MFDGAAVETTVETVTDTLTDTAVDTPVVTEQSDTTETPLNTDTNTIHQEPSLLIISGSHSQQQKLDEAESQLNQHLQNWFASDDFLDQAKLSFNGDLDSSHVDSTQWQLNAEQLQQSFIEGDYNIRVEIRSADELSGALGAYSATGITGEPTIYLNGDWLAETGTDAVAAVLLEEIGHDFDRILNDGNDTAGDEGHHFASLLLYGTTNSVNPVQEVDNLTLEIDGFTLDTEAAAPANIAQTVYIPIDEADAATALATIEGTAPATPSGVITSTIAITPVESGTIIVYDHWEDGYELDLTNPLQASTEIWGDGDLSNGVNPNDPGSDLITPGEAIILQNNVDPGSPVANDYDASDKIGSNQAINVTRGGWDTGIGTNVAGMVNLTSTNNAGTNFVLPIGEDVNGNYGGSFPIFEYTSLHIIAFNDTTTINIDTDGDGAVDIAGISLNEGETYFVDGGIQSGATVVADKDIGLYVIAGEENEQGNYWMNIAPTDQWSDSYYTPVASLATVYAGSPQSVFLFNPSNNAFDVNIVQLDASNDPTTTTITLSANSATRYELTDSGAHIYSEDSGDNFYAVTTSENNLIDWGFPLVAEEQLSSDLVVPWGPGNATNSANENPLWVTAVSDTILYVDSATVTILNADNVPVLGTMIDADTYSYNLTGLESYRVFDNSDNDQTGLRLYTPDGTLIAAAYGTDPNLGDSFDIGASVLAHPDFKLTKTWSEASGDGDNDIELGEQIRYTLTGSNTLNSELTNLNFVDTLPHTDIANYIAGSATLTVYDTNGAVLLSNNNLDGGTGNFPLDGAGYSLADTDPGTGGNQGLQFGQRVEISYLVQVTPTITQELINNTYAFSTGATMSGDEGGSAITPRAAIADITLATPTFPSFVINEDNGVATGDISVEEGSSLSGESFLVFPLNDLTSIDINGTEVISGPYPINIATGEGTISVTGYNANTGVVSYDYTPGGSKDHSGGDVVDNITITITDSTTASASDTLDILITDSSPVANIDLDVVTESLAPASTSGNLLSNDTINVDTTVNVVGVAVGGTGTALIDPLTVAATITGNYGDITVAANGGYTYNLDISNNVVIALNAGQSLTETFTYTVEDSDGTTSFNTLQVTINGINDTPTITIPDINDPNIGQVDVEEDSSFAGVFLVTPINGVATLTLNTIDVTAGPYPVAIPTAEGTITVTGFDQSLGVVSYSYDPSGISRDHSGGAVTDSITIRVIDSSAQVANNTLIINIVDTVPTAVADTNNITEATLPDTVSGNVIIDPAGPDELSGDLANTIVGLAAGNTGADLSSPATIDTPIAGSYGTLIISADGNYTYTLDNTNFDVQALNTTQSLVETFTYTLGDTDGSLSSTTLDITIDGTSAIPVITINDDNAADSGDISVEENSTITGQFNIQPLIPDLSVLTVGGTDLLPNTYPVAITTTEGTLTITSYDAVTGDFSYEYTPSGLGKDHSAGEILDTIIIDIADRIGNTDMDTLDILITDTSPTAIADHIQVIEDDENNVVSGNVITDPITGDQENIDGSLTIVGIAQGTTDANLTDPSTLNRDIAGLYGTLRMNADGSFSYTLDNSLQEVTALDDGEFLSDFFTYTLVDADGSTVYTTLRVEVVGVTDPPNIFIEDPNPILEEEEVLYVESDRNFIEEQALTIDEFDLSAIHNADSSIPQFKELIDESGNSDFIVDSRNVNPRPEQLTSQVTQQLELQARQTDQLYWLEKFADSAAEDLDAVESEESESTIGTEGKATDLQQIQQTLPIQTYSSGIEQFEYAVPIETSGINSAMSYSVTLIDGSPLPDWLVFDEEELKFTGTPPEDFTGELLITLVAEDATGSQTEVLITFRFDPDDSTSQTGPSSLTEQLQQQSLMAWKDQYEQRVDTVRDTRIKA